MSVTALQDTLKKNHCFNQHCTMHSTNLQRAFDRLRVSTEEMIASEVQLDDSLTGHGYSVSGNQLPTNGGFGVDRKRHPANQTPCGVSHTTGPARCQQAQQWLRKCSLYATAIEIRGEEQEIRYPRGLGLRRSKDCD